MKFGKTGKKVIIENKRRAVFSLLMLAIPILHFLIFYLYINLSSFALAFKKYEIISGVGMVSSFAKFENFENAFSQLFSVSGWNMIKNSLIFDAVNLFILTPITLIFSFYIYKKCFMSKFFKVMLFMPYILSEIIVATLYRCMLNNVIPEIMSEWFHVADTTKFQLLTEESTRMGAAIVFNIIMWFGINSLIYSSSMGDINASMSEAAQLDGANVAQEFIYVTIPTIFPTIVTLFTVSLAAIFTDQYRMFSLYKYNEVGSLENVGHFLYMEASRVGKTLGGGQSTTNNTYGSLSAMGLLLSFVVIPVTLVTRKLLNKYGPRAD